MYTVPTHEGSDRNTIPGDLVGCVDTPLETWTKDCVTAWLTDLKKRLELDFDVSKVACPGEAFAARVKDDMEKLAGLPAGIDIFNAKEKLMKKAEGMVERVKSVRCGVSCVVGWYHRLECMDSQ